MEWGSVGLRGGGVERGGVGWSGVEWGGPPPIPINTHSITTAVLTEDTEVMGTLRASYSHTSTWLRHTRVSQIQHHIHKASICSCSHPMIHVQYSFQWNLGSSGQLRYHLIVGSTGDTLLR